MTDQEAVDLRRQILEDVLGDSDHVEEYENFDKAANIEKAKPAHRQRIPLWQFLLHLLRRDKQCRYIRWNTDRVLEFRILDTVGVAALWGSVKNKTDMTYEKLGRAMRYYYGKSIIEKVSGRRYTYRFILSRRTKKYLSQFMTITNDMTQEATNEQTNNNNTIDDDDSCNESLVPDSRPGSPEILDSPQVPSPTRYEETKTYDNIRSDDINVVSSHRTQLIDFPVKIQPVKPTPHQTRTKIFKPNELMSRIFPPRSFTTTTFSDSHRSAFVTPSKIQRNSESCTTKIFQGMPTLERIPSTYDEIVLNSSRKRKSYNDYVDDGSDCDTNSRDSVSPRDVYVEYPKVGKVWNQDFILRKDFMEKQEKNVRSLQEKLKFQRRADPFMGYDVHRLNNERSMMCYDTFEDYEYSTNLRKHAWAA